MQAKSLQTKKILITGASGFIGQHVCEKLASRGIEVHGVSRNKKPKKRDITWWKANLIYPNEVMRVVRLVNPDVIVHLAGEVSGSQDLKVIRPTYENIATSTLNLLEVVTQLKIKRLVLVGSMEESISASEGPGSPYSAAKMTASLYAKLFYSLYKTPVVILRLFMVYGPNQKDLKKIIPYSITSILEGKNLAFSSGNRKVDWVYVDDVVKAVVKSTEVKNIEGYTIDIGSGLFITIKEIIKILASLMKYKKEIGLGKLPDRIFETEIKADLSLAKRHLRWSPKIGIKKGLAETIQWYTKNRSRI